MIDNILIMNLERREDKWWFALGELHALDFPFYGDKTLWGDTIIRYIAHDGLDYPDAEAVHRAAVADGFPYFEKFRMEHPNPAAWHWTFASALRHIREMDTTTLLLIDDFFPIQGWTFRRLCKLIEEASGERESHGEFRGLQLCHSNKAQERRSPYLPHTSMLAKGFAGRADFATVLTGAGADMMLKVHSEPPFDFPDWNFQEVARRGIVDPYYSEGLWHTLDAVVHLGFFGWESDLR